ncbi:MAG TPA: glycosyltransferase family 2 protein [Verrucomicrobiae bacterium]|jgi:hypothetical protein
MRAGQISLIISTYQRPDALEKVLRGVAAQLEMPSEILLADDGSGPPTRAVIEQWQQKLPLRHFWHEDKGFRKTIILNKCIAAARGDYVVLVDGDCVPHRRFIGDHADLAEKIFWVQGRRSFVKEEFVGSFEPASIWSAIFAGRITGGPKAIRWPVPVIRRNTGQRGIIGCNMGFWRDDLIAVNGFDEDYLGWGGEDSDLGTRLYHLGRPRKFVYGRAIVYHLNHPSHDRANAEAAWKRLDETIRSGKIRCKHGLQQYLGA